MSDYIIDSGAGFREIPKGFPGRPVLLPFPELAKMRAEQVARLPESVRKHPVVMAYPWQSGHGVDDNRLAICHGPDSVPMIFSTMTLEYALGAIPMFSEEMWSLIHLVAFTQPIHFVELWRSMMARIGQEHGTPMSLEDQTMAERLPVDAVAAEHIRWLLTKELLDSLQLALGEDYRVRDFAAIAVDGRYAVDAWIEQKGGKGSCWSFRLRLDGGCEPPAPFTTDKHNVAAYAVQRWANRRALLEVQDAQALSGLQTVKNVVLGASEEKESRNAEVHN